MSIPDNNLAAHLQKVLGNRPALSNSVLPTLVRCISLIAQKLRSSQQVAAVGSSNAFGDEQLNVDVLAEKIIRREIQDCPSIVTASSEEEPEEHPVHGGESSDGRTETGNEEYTLAFDPLDGSSIIAPNWTVGTIIGLWEGASALHGVPAEKQVAALLGVYGPRTTVIVALRVPGLSATCFEIGLGQDTELACEIVRPEIKMLEAPSRTRYFAPANLRAAAEDEKYFALVTHYVRSKYTLRYSGGLVPDIVHALVKGHGIYVSPVTAVSKAKLRRLYELTPIALIMECVGASAIDPVTGEGVLARPIEHCDERAGLICGTMEEVSLVKQMLDLP